MLTVIFVNTIESKKAEKELLDILLSRLSDRELEFLKYFAEGHVWPEDKRLIGKKMDVLPGTLDKFLARIREKLNVEDFDKIIRIVKMHIIKSSKK